MWRKPRVTSRPRPGNAPSSESSALVATVVPCATADTSPSSKPASRATLCTPLMNPTDGSAGVDGVLVVCIAPVSSSSATTSVKVPPVSSASRKRGIDSKLVLGVGEWAGHHPGDPALGTVGGSDVDPVAAARDVAVLE